MAGSMREYIDEVQQILNEMIAYRKYQEERARDLAGLLGLQQEWYMREQRLALEEAKDRIGRINK